MWEAFPSSNGVPNKGGLSVWVVSYLEILLNSATRTKDNFVSVHAWKLLLRAHIYLEMKIPREDGSIERVAYRRAAI